MPAPRPTGTQAAAGLAVALGAFAVVLLALPYKPFELDRFFVPKEVALAVAALGATLCALVPLRRCAVTGVDRALAAFLALSTLSALLAGNGWLAWRALVISLAGAALFWSARGLAGTALRHALLAALAAATVAGAVTALLQAYGVRSEYFSLQRAPGGTFGNRNFMAHLAAIGLPLLVAVAIEARTRAGALVGAAGVALVSAALVLSRTRAAWLALVAGALAVVLGVLVARVRWRGTAAARRVRLLAAAAGVGTVAALALPNALDWRSASPYLDSVRSVVDYREGSGRGRVLQYRNSLRLAARHALLGVGPGNWAAAYPRAAPAGDPSLDADAPGTTANPWPSSDWVAFAAERGVIAAGLLAVVFVALGAHAWLRARTALTVEELVPALALGGTVVVTLVAGLFDAVLLLAAPTFLVWTTLGLLAEPRRRATAAVPARVRRWGVAVVVGVGALALARGTGMMLAMAIATEAHGTGALERASRLDPGSYRIQLRLASAYAVRGRCAEVRAHGGAVRALLPVAHAPRRLLARCGVREGD